MRTVCPHIFLQPLIYGYKSIVCGLGCFDKCPHGRVGRFRGKRVKKKIVVVVGGGKYLRGQKW